MTATASLQWHGSPIASIWEHFLGASAPRRLGVRRIRARVASLQVADERVSAAALREERFFDMLHDRIVPNARRDGFEPNQHFANLINHVSVLG